MRPLVTPQQLAVLRFVAERPGATAILGELGDLDVRLEPTLRNLIGKGLIQRTYNWVDGETLISLTEAGRLAEFVAKTRPPCQWCGNRAVEGQRLRDSYRVTIFYCDDHLDVGREAAENQVLSSKGSLHGLIRTGKIKPRQPDEVAA